MKETVAIVAGAGPCGITTSASLNLQSIPHIVLEREDTFCPIWTKYSYDRLHLHLAKQFCELAYMPFPKSYPTYVPRKLFVQYIEEYMTKFNVNPVYNRCIESANYDKAAEKWLIKVRNTKTGEVEEYRSRFLVLATGETTDPFIPEIEGLETFTGTVLHSTQYKTGKPFKNKRVLIVGCGNSGMELAYDLSENFGAITSIVIRHPTYIITRWMGYMALVLFPRLPFNLVDIFIGSISKLWYGDMTKYGIEWPQEGPYERKEKYGKYPVVDVGTARKIKSGEIQVLPGISSIKGDEVIFTNGKSYQFDVILLATGFHRSIKKWLQDDEGFVGEDGLAKERDPNPYWKGKNGLYCAGLARKGLIGAGTEGQNIANDIKKLL